ncbi:MAG TPA: dihydroneopterin aldolase [Polyangiaceae bacterium]|nr:dihydroneopterin aldolase [Polyangiaceae bacterium]
MAAHRDILSINGLDVLCVVGVYPKERGTPQPLSVDAELVLDTEIAARSARLSRSIDYDAVARQIEAVLVACRFRLLETAAHALATLLLAPPAPGEKRGALSSVKLRLEKPEALAGRATAALTIERDKNWLKMKSEQAPFGGVDILHETREASLYRLHLRPSRQVRLPALPEGSAGIFCLSDGLALDGDLQRAHRSARLDARAGHTVINAGKRDASLLLVTCQKRAALTELASGEAKRDSSATRSR